MCESCVGFDANALYLWAIMQPMPTGPYIRRQCSTGFIPVKQKVNASYAAQEYLDYITFTTGNNIQHRLNGGEKQLGRKRIRVDGWCPKTQTVYQFQGCYYHGHSCELNTAQVNTRVQTSMPALAEHTKKISDYLEKLGYNVIEIKECEWREMKKTNNDVKLFLNNRKKTKWTNPTPISTDKILTDIKRGRLFGVVECDIQVPPALRDHFKEMTPIFKNIDIQRKDIGEVMSEYAETNNIMNTARQGLIGSYFGKNIMLITPLLQWYVDHGLEVTNIYAVTEWEPNACFSAFGDNVSDARRAGDTNPDLAIIADTMKLLGNSAYGKTVTNKEKHLDVKYVDSDQAKELINDKRFKAVNEINENLYEVEMMKQRIHMDLPLQIGFFVYQYAKLKMLAFYYDFLDYYIDRQNFEYCEMDTDSAYIALGGKTLAAVIKPERRSEFYQRRHEWLPNESCEAHRSEYITTSTQGGEWVAPTCCQKVNAYEKRTPGLFKIEWKGTGIISLCSKTYYCFGKKDKCSTKGLSQTQNQLNKEIFLDVLTTRQSKGGKNVGFRVNGGDIYTYVQQRAALSYFYPKRQVLSDGVSTIPLEI